MFPARRIVAGTMIERTITVSIRTPTARPIPISLIVMIPAVANEPKTPIRIRPAAVTIRPVCWSPVATDSSLSCVSR